MSLLFVDPILAVLAEQAALIAQSSALTSLRQSFLTISIQVSKRFTNAVGPDLYTAETAAFMAELLGGTYVTNVKVRKNFHHYMSF